MKTIVKLMLWLAMALTMAISCSTRIDAGCEGIRVNLYGSEKGVDEISLVTGRVWYNPVTTEVYEYPAYVQTVDYEPFTINAKDGSEFTTDEIVSQREAVELAIEEQLRAELEKENFLLEQLTSGLKYPQSIVESVNAKNRAVPEAQRVANELEIVKAEAEKKRVAAEAEYKANMLRTKALTPAILQQHWIEKWDGSLPKVVTEEGAGMFLNLSK